MKFFDFLKTILLILVILQFAPMLIEGIRKQYTQYIEPKTQVGVIEMKGLLTDSSSYIKKLHTFFKNTEIKAILLKMDCQGSASGTGQAIAHELQQLKHDFHKPVVVLVENVCASGGYWIATSADHIIAPGTALIGSIGSKFSYMFQLREFIENYKVKYIALKAGTYKAASDPFVDLTAPEQALLQSVLDDTYQQFTHAVAQARKLSLNKVNEWADGKIFTAHQALKLGLIDEIGSSFNAVKVIKDKALIENDIEWIYPPKEGGLFASLFGSQDEDGSLIASAMNSACSFVEQRYAGKVY